MPQRNRFRHQTYTSTRPTSPHWAEKAGEYPAVGSPEFRQRMRDVGAAMAAQDVAAVYLVHGTFVGPDALGILSELARLFPAAGAAVRGIVGSVMQRLTSEVGNFTESYARLFESALAAPGRKRIPVRLFQWSSENHHLGRADGAVRLIDELASLGLERGQRVLLWGHSHAGNLFALMSNLLGGDEETVRRFFDAASVYFRVPLVGLVDVPVWQRTCDRLSHGFSPLAGVHMDMVTFGTPIRYGWDSSGYSKLMHFIFHRPAEGLPEYRAAWPPAWDDVLHAAGGDYVQQLGIAGTNVPPSPVSWRAWMADRRLGALLQPAAEGTPLDWFRAGAIVPDEGTTMLVDYGQADENISQHHAGHSVYTRRQWLLFHCEQVARQFYRSMASMVA